MEETRLQEPEPNTTIMYAAPPPPHSRGSHGRGRGRNGGRGRGRGRSFPSSQHYGYHYYQQQSWRPSPPLPVSTSSASSLLGPPPHQPLSQVQAYAVSAPSTPSRPPSYMDVSSWVHGSQPDAALTSQFDALSLRTPPDQT